MGSNELTNTVTAEQVLATYRRGDWGQTRHVAARFILDNQSLIRSIARSRLASASSVFDSDEVVATVLRRVDRYVESGRFSPTSADDVWGLVNTIAKNSSVTKARLAQRVRTLAAEDGEYAHHLLDQLNRCASDDDASELVTRLMLCVPDERDRQIIGFRLQGTNHRVTAQFLGMTEAAARKRWSDLLMMFRRALADWEKTP